MRRSAAATPDRYQSIHLQQRQSADERFVARAKRSQFLSQSWEQMLLQNLPESTENIV
jgi:hypothetical protein